ncbi:ATG8-interacting protein 1 [Dendrobium catenatum]|uniref:ATG8-interacting protein 1 n=1 Tax=Dendrobium catenatum TaxID=906689 RepID=UPI0009F29C85|nr:ATG8-interacting protein 1 [Dendrobium catenatum]
MADEEEKDGTSSRGADWEVVALTSSTYAAAPGPDADQPDDPRDKEFQREHDSSNTMFMSEHFVFPPHEHENLPIESDSGEIHDQTGCLGILPTEEENNYLDEFDEDSSEAEPPIHNMESQESQTHSFSLAGIESRQMIPPDDENDISEIYDPSNKLNDMPPDFANHGKISDGNDGQSGLPCEVWWKRHALSLCKQVKETNTFWSIFMAAAVMGLLVLGKQWKREKLQLQQLRWQFSNTNERMGRLLGSVNRFKYAFVSGHRHGSLIHGGAAAANL